MKICSKCGTEFSDDYNFCEKCGAPLTEGSTDKKTDTSTAPLEWNLLLACHSLFS